MPPHSQDHANTSIVSTDPFTRFRCTPHHHSKRISQKRDRRGPDAGTRLGKRTKQREVPAVGWRDSDNGTKATQPAVAEGGTSVRIVIPRTQRSHYERIRILPGMIRVMVRGCRGFLLRLVWDVSQWRRRGSRWGGGAGKPQSRNVESSQRSTNGEPSLAGFRGVVFQGEAKADKSWRRGESLANAPHSISKSK